MADLSLITTSVGLLAILDAQSHGLQVSITHMAVGSVGWSPSPSATALQDEEERVTIASSSIDATNYQININAALVSSGNAYWVREVGFFDENDTLIFIWSHPTETLAYKSAALRLLLGLALRIYDAPLGSIQIIDEGLPLDLSLSDLDARLDAHIGVGGSDNHPIFTNSIIGFMAPERLATATPLMDGAAEVGTALKLAREDHRHPTDTSRAPLASPALTGTPTAPNAALGTRGTRLATMESFATEFATVLSGTGSQRLPSGLHLRWGSGQSQPNPGASILFHTAFPTACLAVICGDHIVSLTNPVEATASYGVTAAGFSAVCNAGAANNAFYYVAIGY